MYVLIKEMKKKYPNKKLVFVMDNYVGHKSSLVMKIVQAEKVKMIFTPSNSP